MLSTPYPKRGAVLNLCENLRLRAHFSALSGTTQPLAQGKNTYQAPEKRTLRQNVDARGFQACSCVTHPV